jgi:outer membrane autotransporter protein
MRFALPPVAAKWLAVSLPALSSPVWAADVIAPDNTVHGQIVINDPAGQGRFHMGASSEVRYDGPGAAVEVSGAGNRFESVPSFTVQATSPTDYTQGIRATAGGVASFSQGVFNTQGHALEAGGANSLIESTGANSQFTTWGDGAYEAHAAYAHDGGRITAVNSTIVANGVGSIAVRASDANSSIVLHDTSVLSLHGEAVSVATQASVTMVNGALRTTGRGGSAVRAYDPGTTFSATNTTIDTAGVYAYGVLVSNGASVTLDRVRLDTTGARSSSIWSYHLDPTQHTTVTISNGSRINTQDGYGFNASGGSHTFLVSDSTLTSRIEGDLAIGELLHTDFVTSTVGGVSTITNSQQITLDATRSVLTGDVVAADGTVDVSLKQGTVLTGALKQRATGHINALTLDADSTWNVRGDSSLGTLVNAGTVAFVPPASSTDFKTLTVQNYQGGGTLVLNTRLGDDTSATDKLVIDGGSATGNTALRVINADGAGGQTVTGIRLVETLNGGTTAADAFHLDAASSGFRASAGTLAVNGYEYSLVRGGHGGVATDWYLTSSTALAPDLTDAPATAGQALWPQRPAARNVSPESGAYLGNRLASARFFSHSLRDRVAAPGYGGAAAYAATGTGGDGGDASADTRALDNAGRGLWTRVEGRQDSGLRMAQGRVNMDTDSTILQLGGDLIKAPLSQGGAVYAGLMGGYGDARTTSNSTLRRPDGATAQVRARGKVSGYSVGLYGTVYQNDATRMGAYADTWLQFGRYANQINSELGSARYHSTVWSAAVEAGYAVKPFADGSTLGPVVVEPHAQLIYSRYDAQDATLQGTRLRSGSDNAWNSRIGVRLYPQVAPNAPAVRPFLEANWLHSFGDPSVNMGPNTLDAALSRNSLELKLGAEGQVSRAVQVAGHVFGQAGNSNQRGYGGMVNLGYRW